MLLIVLPFGQMRLLSSQRKRKSRRRSVVSYRALLKLKASIGWQTLKRHWVPMPEDPDGLVKWQSKLYYFCEALNEDETISTRDRIEIMRGIMDANSDAQLDQAIGDEIKESQVVNDTDMKLEACVLNNRALSCDFLVKTTETAKKLKVYAAYQYEASRLIDNQGNTYLASFINLAGVERNNYISTDLPPDVPMRGRLVFENISNRATSGALLEVTGVLEGKVTPFEFRDISFD